MSKKNTIDLSNFDTKRTANDGMRMTVKHPGTLEPLVNDAGEEVYITLAGVDSDAYQQATNERTNKRLKKTVQQGELDTSAEQLERESLDVLAACTLEWNIPVDGEVPECTPDNAKKAYGRFPWLREQVDAFINNRRNYLKN